MKETLLILIIFGFLIGVHSRNYVERKPRLLFVYRPAEPQSNLIVGYRQCIAKNSDGTVTGACMNYFSCILQKGSIQGKCGFGFKACCVFPSTTTTTAIPTVTPTVTPTETPTTTEPTVIEDTEIFENEEISTSTDYTITQISSSYCQVKLTFLTLMLKQPNIDGVCQDEKLFVTPVSNEMPEICGINNGQHVYLDFSDSPTFVLSIQVNNPYSRWTIQSSQILCTGDDRLAPDNCLQYYSNERAGNVWSFNFPFLLTPDSTVTYQLANTNYQVCVDSPDVDYCGVTWKERVSNQNNFYFTVSRDVDALTEDSLGTDRYAESGALCTTDYVRIINGQYTDPATSNPATANLFCGAGFYSEVTSHVGPPFRFGVKTDGQEPDPANPDRGNAGFYLFYRLLTQC